MIEHKFAKNEHNEDVLTITVTGGWEIFRLSHHLMQGQVEFGSLARRIFVHLRRGWGIKAFREHDQRMTGGYVVKNRWHLTIKEDYR